MTVYYQNPFYDDVFGTIGVVIPSKRIGYKQGPDKKITEIVTPKGSKDFEQNFKKAFPVGSKPEWPYKGRLLVSISILIKRSDYARKDIDNISKSILDALKGLAFVDDIQVDCLHVVKFPSDEYSFMIGIKQLKEDDRGWYHPPLYSEKPFPKS